jgi:predicted ATPase/transcriptional regulator with XRE-family HTH domain
MTGATCYHSIVSVCGAMGMDGDSFGARLRRLREAAALTQEELAERAGLAAKGVGALERGERRRPHPHTLRALANALGLGGDELAALVGERPARKGRTTPTTPPLTVAAPPPPAAAPLVGRETAVAELVTILGEERLVTLTGPGGVGKTRLALAVAEAVGGAFADGTAFVALAPLTDPASVPAAVAASLRVWEVPGRPLIGTLLDYLIARQFLLVLDNAEHLLDATAELVAALTACPRLAMLVTSRAPLRMRGEREWAVPPLDVPTVDSETDVADVLEVPAVQLFMRQARAARPGFAPTAASVATLAAICRRLDGLPLALELAAARVRLLDPVELLARLDRALPLLAGGPRDLPARQRAMRNTIAWSHDLLDEGPRRVFRRLAPFVGGWTVEAAEAVCGGGTPGEVDALDALTRLVEHSLATLADDPASGGVRGRLLEPIRQFAGEELAAAGEEGAARERHAAYFRAFAERAAPQLYGAEQARWLDRLDAEGDNLRAALGGVLARGKTEEAARLCWALHRFWWIRGHLAEGRRWAEQVLARGDGLAAPLRARALLAAGYLIYAQGDHPAAAARAAEALPLAREGDDHALLGIALALAGFAALGLGATDRAAARFGEALALYEGAGDRWGVGLVLTGLGYVALAEGDPARGARLLVSAEVPLRAANSPWELATNLNMQAALAEGRGDNARIAALSLESLTLLAALRDRWSVAYTLTRLGGVAAAHGQPARAAQLFGAADALRETTGATIQFASDRDLYERHVALARAGLDAPDFAAAWGTGRAMSLGRAIEFALEALPVG